MIFILEYRFCSYSVPYLFCVFILFSGDILFISGHYVGDLTNFIFLIEISHEHRDHCSWYVQQIVQQIEIILHEVEQTYRWLKPFLARGIFCKQEAGGGGDRVANSRKHRKHACGTKIGK
jgi:hypothetical protein